MTVRVKNDKISVLLKHYRYDFLRNCSNSDKLERYCKQSTHTSSSIEEEVKVKHCESRS